MAFSKPCTLEYPSNRNFRNAGTIHDTDAEEIVQFVKEEILFLNHGNDEERKTKELILQCAHTHGIEGAMELTALNTAWRIVVSFAMDHEEFIAQNECIRQQNDIKVTFDAYFEVILQQAGRHFLIENGVIDPIIIAPYTSKDERLKEITHRDLQTKLRGIASQYVFYKTSKGNQKRVTRYELNVHHAMMEFTNIGKNRPFFNRIMRSELKFILKDKWAIDLDFNTATLIDSQRNFHMGLELADQHNNETEYLFSDDNGDIESTNGETYETLDNDKADNISRNNE